MLFFVILLCIIILLLVLLSIPFYVIVEYEKNAVDNSAEVKLRIFGLTIKLVPSETKSDKTKKENVKKEKARKGEDGEDQSLLEKFRTKLNYWLDLFNAVKDDIADVLDYLERRFVVIKELSFVLLFGFDDAAINGVMTGVLNGVVYNILGFAHRHITIKKWKVNVQPDFYAKRFDVDVRCIFRIKPVHIIVVVLKVLKIYFKLRRLRRKLAKET